jgi:formate hydrogenlyase subunit 3/multisubunit Na+/H+ antiporter MnhD subunit
MEKTPMPIVAGSLTIVSGGLSLIIFIGLLISITALAWTAADVTGWLSGMSIALNVLIILAVFSLVFGLLALVGGIYAVQRKKWGWALTGSICALVPTFVFGLAAITLVAISKDEFE